MKNYNHLQSYCQIISLLCHDDEDRYIGNSFILLQNPHDIFYPVDNTHGVIEAFSEFHGNCSVANDERAKRWIFFPDVMNEMLLTCQRVEKALLEIKGASDKNNKLTSKEKILFVGDLLRVVENQTQDVKVKLLLLVSVMEFMIARNPDTSKFNVEDSISRQFVLKASIIIYNVYQDIDLGKLKEHLKRIYSQRSDVAHGNYIPKNNQQLITDSFYQLYKYIRAIMSEYVRDKKFVDFIKEN